jgi:hypothetical protein
MNNFIGVVENTNDPLELNRLQVRCLGYHNSKLSELPSESLPWAQVMLPLTDSGVGGIGSSISITEGTWVVGFWQDKAETMPIIMGSLPGNSVHEEKPNKQEGFRDPLNNYPAKSASDLPKSAGKDYRDSKSYILKEKPRHSNVPIARGLDEKMESAAVSEENGSTTDEANDAMSWNLPSLEDTIRPEYPSNHVRESISGHIHEVDDTPGSERISTLHKSGTYQEMIHDGSMITSVVGKNFKIVMDGENTYVEGDLNLTVTGNLTTRVEKDYHLEVLGDMTEIIHGSRRTKIGHNLQKEISQDMSTIITGKEIRQVLEGRYTKIQGEDDELFVEKDLMITSSDLYAITNNVKVAAQKTITLSAATSIDVKSTNINMSTNYAGEDGQIFSMNQLDSRCTGNIVVYGDVWASPTGDAVSLYYHTHLQNAGDDAGAGGITDPAIPDFYWVGMNESDWDFDMASDESWGLGIPQSRQEQLIQRRTTNYASWTDSEDP